MITLVSSAPHSCCSGPQPGELLFMFDQRLVRAQRRQVLAASDPRISMSIAFTDTLVLVSKRYMYTVDGHPVQNGFASREVSHRDAFISFSHVALFSGLH